MNYVYETNRLFLKLPSADLLRELLDFQIRNQELFEKYEPMRPDNFYTPRYQQAVLKSEMTLALKRQAIRFYVFCKQEPHRIVGTVCLHNIVSFPYSCSEVGYKFDAACHHHGYATEALAKVLSIAFEELQLHRVYARVMPQNTPSIRLLQRLGFLFEGTEHQCLFLQGKWTDHLRYACIRPNGETNAPMTLQ